MRKRIAAVALALTLAVSLALPWSAGARGGGRSSGSSHSSGSHSSIGCLSCSRHTHGRIQRSREAVDEFKRTHPKPPGCDHCEVDHIVPLSKGGRDDPSNMQWLPHDVHREKTKQDLYGK